MVTGGKVLKTGKQAGKFVAEMWGISDLITSILPVKQEAQSSAYDEVRSGKSDISEEWWWFATAAEENSRLSELEKDDEIVK